MSPKSLVQPWAEAFNTADVKAISALCTADAINHQVAESPVEDAPGIQEMFEREFAAADMHCIVENLFEDGEWAILE